MTGTLQSEKFNPYENYRFQCPNFPWVYVICIRCKCEKCKYFKEVLNTNPYPMIECWRKIWKQ